MRGALRTGANLLDAANTVVREAQPLQASARGEAACRVDEVGAEVELDQRGGQPAHLRELVEARAQRDERGRQPRQRGEAVVGCVELAQPWQLRQKLARRERILRGIQRLERCRVARASQLQSPRGRAPAKSAFESPAASRRPPRAPGLAARIASRTTQIARPATACARAPRGT